MRDSDTAPQEGVISYEEAYRNRATKSLAPLAELEAEKPLRERKSVKDLKSTEEDTKILKTAIGKAISSGDYQKFVTFHSQYMYTIHSMLEPTNERFLPWHRIYLLKFEEMLNNVMKKETGKDYNIAIPYWDWEHDRDLPEFLKDLTPTMNVEVYLYDINTGRPLNPPSRIYTLTVKRFPGRVNDLPTEQQLDRIRNEQRYDNFTRLLEEGPHGDVHVWVGGTNPRPDRANPFDVRGAMAIINISPLDFCFWLHHANIDRIWAEWQKKQEDQGNTLHIYPDLNETGGSPTTSARMDPWIDIMERQTRKIEVLGYRYK
jgi:tyrosinase